VKDAGVSSVIEPRLSLSITTNQARREILRQSLVRIVFVIYWLLILEGGLRKWGLPELGQAFFFIRVPATLILYWLAFRHGRWPRTSWPLAAAYCFAVLTVPLAVIQLIMGGYGQQYLLLVGYGWINYFFYVPLAFLIAEQFEREDLQRVVRHTVWLTIAAVPLVVLQFASNADSVINLGSADDESNQFKNLGAALGYVRPTGFFSSTLGQSLFVASAFALLLAAWLERNSKGRPSRVALLSGTGAVMVMTALSQSRSLFFMLGLVLLAVAFAGLLAGRWKLLMSVCLVSAAGLVLVYIVWPIFLPTAYEVFLTRWQDAYSSETYDFQFAVFGRAFHGFYAFLDYLPDTPFFGYLLGLGGNAASQLPWVQLPRAADAWNGYGVWGEDGWSRHIIELGPAVGLAFIAFRVAITAWLFRKVVRATRGTTDILPMILFGFVSITMLNGQITGHGTVNGYAWLFVGFCLAACATSRSTRHAEKKSTQNGIAVQQF
jgi:hypothetical protein